MSAWEDLVKAGAKAAADVAGDPAWVHALAERLDPLIDEHVEEGTARTMARIALGTIEGNAEKIAGLGAEGLMGLMGTWSAGGEDLAREVYLRHHAPMADVLKAMDELDGASVRRAKEGGSAWETLAAVWRFVQPAAPYLLPLLGLVV